MSALLQECGAVCIFAVAAGLVLRLCGENAMLRFAASLGVLALLLSLLLAALRIDWQPVLSPEAQPVGEELTSFVEEQTAEAAARALEDYLSGLLAAAQIDTEKIEAETTIREDGGIECTMVYLRFRYESEAQRARALLANVLGRDVPLEVTVDGS